MIIELTVPADPKAYLSQPTKKALNTRLIAEIDPLFQPASEDDSTPVPVGSAITMHSGKKHRVLENLNVIMQKMGGRS